jgi:glutamine---fructose-6-phosphate transaminase (isomerizing)
MCGIVGYSGSRPVLEILLQGLKRLEYRGYDSAGVAFFQGGKIEVRKSEGKLENVEKLLAPEMAGKGVTCGIGHTRWATHGKPTTQNAHPHRTGHVVLVHNGIIENYQEIKRELVARGHLPASETDSELFGFLVLELMDDKGLSLTEAVRTAFQRLKGQCSVVVMSEKEEGVVVGVRNGSPLVAAHDPQGGALLASDAQPLLNYTRDVHFLENGDLVVGTAKGLSFLDLETGKKVDRASTRLDWSADKMDKQGYAHFMLKEIHEQPTALVDTLNAVLDRAKLVPFPLAHQPGVKFFDQVQEISLVACGTAWHAAFLGKYWLERWAQIRVNVELASEFRYRMPVLSPNTVVMGISQSGETADTLAALREVKKQNIPTVAITNSRGSTLSREAEAILYTSAGPEIGVAATKTFTTQMLNLMLLAGHLAIERVGQPGRTPGVSRPDAKRVTELFDDVVRLPHVLAAALEGDSKLVSRMRAAAKGLFDSKGFFFIGRGTSFPMALEGALKLKEIAYYHAEGYAAGELKHGPIAMIDKGMTVVVLAPQDHWRDKTVSNLEEVKARGARILGMGDARDSELERLCDFFIPLPAVEGKPLDESLSPFLLAPMVQLLSYELACLRGTDVDKPRNLAKSVTVE